MKCPIGNAVKAKKKKGGVWRTTDEGNRIFIQGGVVRAGGPNGKQVGKASKAVRESKLDRQIAAEVAKPNKPKPPKAQAQPKATPKATSKAPEASPGAGKTPKVAKATPKPKPAPQEPTAAKPKPTDLPEADKYGTIDTPFKKVAKPEPNERTATTKKIKAEGVEQEVSLEAINTFQNKVDRHSVSKLKDNPSLGNDPDEPVLLLKSGSSYTIYDGNHRASAAKYAGSKKIKAIVLDTNPTDQGLTKAEQDAVTSEIDLVSNASVNNQGCGAGSKGGGGFQKGNTCAKGGPKTLGDYESSPGSLRFKKGADLEGMSVAGVSFTKEEGGFWNQWKDIDVGETPLPTPTKGMGVSTGIVIEEADGRVWLFEPMNAYGGYKYAFPKGRIESGLTGQQNAIKEVFEETGLKVEITGLVGDFTGTTTHNRFYRGKRVGGDPSQSGPEAYAVRLVTPDAAEKLFKRQAVTMPGQVLEKFKHPKEEMPGFINKQTITAQKKLVVDLFGERFYDFALHQPEGTPFLTAWAKFTLGGKALATNEALDDSFMQMVCNNLSDAQYILLETLTLNTGCGAGGGKGKPGFQKGNTCAGGGGKIPAIPTFISSIKANVAVNVQAAKEMRDLAKAGDLQALKAHPGTPSPKLKAYKEELIKVLSSQPKSTKAKVTKPATQPKQQSTAGTVLSPKQIREAISKHTGLSETEIVDAVTKPADPVSNSSRAKVRAQIASAVLELGLQQQNAVLNTTSVGSAERATAITVGDKAKAAKEYAQTPLYDVNCLSSIKVSDKPISGQAVCYMNTQSVEMGSTSVTGDYRHELGHALRASMGGGYGGKTKMTEAVDTEYTKVKENLKNNPPPPGVKLPYDVYETQYGVIGRRGLDNWEENAAEHYRGYHREIYRDKYEGGDGKHLEQYRQRHPGWARIWDAHYTTALLGTDL